MKSASAELEEVSWNFGGPNVSSIFKSQRDFVLQPKVGAQRLPWVGGRRVIQPRRGCANRMANQTFSKPNTQTQTYGAIAFGRLRAPGFFKPSYANRFCETGRFAKGCTHSWAPPAKYLVARPCSSAVLRIMRIYFVGCPGQSPNLSGLRN